MEEETDPERVFERFMQVDPREHTNLDRLFDATRRQFKLNEAQSDIELWDGIESRFRSERLFWDAGHPAWACWWPVAEAMLQFLDQYLHLGVDAQVMKALRSRLDQISPLRYYDAPVHPRIAEHFGLSWHRPDMRYRLDHDGWFTYEEWVRRFIGFRFDLRCYSGYWHTFKQCGDRRQGERDLRGALEDSPNNAQTNFYLATNLLWSDRPAEALTEVEAALADPDVAADSRSPALHAEILLRLKRPAEAVEAARRATALMPQNADYHRLFGKALRESGQSGVGPSREGLSDETLSAFRKAVDLDPFKVANWNELGFQLVLEKDEPAAETCLQRVLDLDADNILALGHLAVIHDNRRDLAQALPMARRAVSLDPENIGLLRRLGSIALRAGLLEEAEAACRRATALGEKDFYAWFDLGNVLFRLGRFAEADEATQTALALNPKIPVFSFQAGEIRASLGDDASAREYFRVAAELAPDNAKMRAKYEAVK